MPAVVLSAERIKEKRRARRRVRQGSQNPDNDANTFVFNMRFSGQRYDAASGLNYNYFRDYEAATGRYSQSDPIGLKGGRSTYSYVGGNPFTSIDPSGLAITGSWIKPPKLNIVDYSIDRTDLVSPSWSWWGYVKFVRVYGHASGFVNIDVKCRDDCNDWEIHNRISVAAKGYLDAGPNAYALIAGILSRSPYVGGALNIALAGGSLLEAEHHFLNLANEKAGPIISTLSANGPTAICLGALK